MSKGLIAKKLGMTSVFTPAGEYVPVTVLEAGPCVVTQVKTRVRDGYDALQLGFGSRSRKHVNRPTQGHLEKSGHPGFGLTAEVPVDNPENYTPGQNIQLDIFSVGERVDVLGTTKGRGFAGVIKRHGFHGGKDTHGSHSHRVPGSIGCSAYPAKVIRGKKLPGQFGNARNTTRNLEIVDIRPEQNLLLVKGAVPGPKSGIVRITKIKFAQ